MNHNRCRNSARTMLGLLAVTALLAACGGDDDDAAPVADESVDEQVDEPSPEPAAEASAGEPADAPEVIDAAGVLFFREGTGQVTVSLTDGSMYRFDTTCSVYIDRFEETYEHSVDDATFAWYSRVTDDDDFATMTALLDEYAFSATVADGFGIEPNGNNFDASVTGLVSGEGETTVQVQSVCNE